MNTSIIMAHYSEDEDRDAVALRCIHAIQPYRREDTEFILVCNGYYPNLSVYADIYFEREVDASPGKSFNIGARIAKGNVLVFMCDDILVNDNWLDECRDIVLNHPRYMVTPTYPRKRKYHELPMVDGYYVNHRVGSDIIIMTREQFNDVGEWDEVNPMYDGSNYINRRVQKGYAVMMTKTQLVNNIGTGHSYARQQAEMGYTYRQDYKDKKWLPM
jgi:glycosyltransferase involved in cell wall biosynthesis